MPRVYVFTILFSLVAGLLIGMLAPSGKYRLLIKLLFLIFVIILLNEKTAFLEDLLSHKTRRRLRALGFIILFIFFLLMILEVFR